MNIDHKELEQILRYVHGEITELERQEFEVRFRESSALRQEVEVARQISTRMKSLRGAVGNDWEKLADRIVHEIEIDEAVCETPVRRKSRLILFRSVTVLAAAAAIVLLLAVPRYLTNPIDWGPPIVGQDAQLRQPGETTQSLRKYTQEELRQSFDRFRVSLDREYRHSSSGLREFFSHRKWKLSTSIQEMRAGRVAVFVAAARSDESSRPREWTEYYHDLNAWRDDADALGARIAKELGKVDGHDGL